MSENKALVGVVMGSKSDWPTLGLAVELLEELMRCKGVWSDAIDHKLRAHGLDPEPWRELVERLADVHPGASEPARDVQPGRGFRLHKRIRQLVDALLSDD